MGYDLKMVKQAILDQFGGVEALASSVGISEGGSRESQHQATSQFWEQALATAHRADII